MLFYNKIEAREEIFKGHDYINTSKLIVIDIQGEKVPQKIISDIFVIFF